MEELKQLFNTHDGSNVLSRPLDDLLEPISHFDDSPSLNSESTEKKQFLGSGVSGSVYKVSFINRCNITLTDSLTQTCDPSLHKLYALKVISKELYTSKEPILAEYNILRSLHSKCGGGFPCYYACFSDSSSYYMIMEYIPGITLAFFIDTLMDTNQQVSVIALVSIFKNLLSLIKTLHASGIYHMDIKDENIKIHGKRLVLLDYGNACTMSHFNAVGSNKLRLLDLKLGSCKTITDISLQASPQYFALACRDLKGITIPKSIEITIPLKPEEKGYTEQLYKVYTSLDYWQFGRMRLAR